MSQNQSYFWQTTRNNVYLRRCAKLQMLLAFLAILSFSTICVAEIEPNMQDQNVLPQGVLRQSGDDKNILNAGLNAEPVEQFSDSDATKVNNVKSGFIDAFTASISVILFTELGDKTFFIAAIMAMRHPRLIVFAGAISALALMTVLSVVFGMAATIIPKVYTYYISTALFAIFGLKMIYEGYFMKATDAQEELEEVQSDLRKREEGLIRTSHGTVDDADAKRKNSNSDKEDVDTTESSGVANTVLPNGLHPELQHRQRKQLFNHKGSGSNVNNNNNKCESSIDADYDDCTMNGEVFLGGENLKLPTFHSSLALSSSGLSNETNETNCDEFSNSPHKLTYKVNVGDTPKLNRQNDNRTPAGDVKSEAAMVHSASAAAIVLSKNNVVGASNNSINSIGSLSLNSTVAAGQRNGELKQIGGSKKRLERDVTAALVQDPESGVVRKNVKKSATYITTRVLMQAFTMTFLAEWGDRSQLTTIILAASKNVYGVITGGIIGHSICTGLAVIGGRMVAAKISVRTVTIVGGIVFVGFALYALVVRPDDI